MTKLIIKYNHLKLLTIDKTKTFFLIKWYIKLLIREIKYVIYQLLFGYKDYLLNINTSHKSL